MILDAVPVIPPDLRPMVQLDGGRFATSDLNDLYRRVINRNNRLKRLLDLGAPEIIVNNEKRMLQEAVDALFDNGRRGRPVTGPGNRPLKSLSDMLKGKQGRFRQNLLGKRVDYSGRSVIVVGPTLKLHQCGLPKQMALELFKPFVMKRLVDLELAQNIKSAKRMVERRRAQVWDVLEDVIKEHPVFLNRAPTLHRLGIQAFEPQLVEGKAIQLHPLVCRAFNADFDGDQMAVHLPLSAEAQAEARILMLSSNNILSPASGRPMVDPTQDMIFGAYYLTLEEEGVLGEGRAFRQVYEVEQAYERGEIHLHALDPAARRAPAAGGRHLRGRRRAGRIFFNEALPAGLHRTSTTSSARRRRTARSTRRSSRSCGSSRRWPTPIPKADRGRRASTSSRTSASSSPRRSGLTISIDDVRTPPDKQQILDKYEKEAEKAEQQFKRGIITDDERRNKEVEIWESARGEVGRAMDRTLGEMKFNPLDMMVTSGARGNPQQVRQIAGMKGLVTNPKGEMIPRPITSSFREGLSVLEYFISTHGARKGLADTALRTADSGYLTRRLVDVAQELIVREMDCGTTRGLWLEDIQPDEAGRRSHLDYRLYGRVLVEPAGGFDAGHMVTEDDVVALRDDKTVDRRPGPLGAHVRGRLRHLRQLLRHVARDPEHGRARRGRRRHRRPVHRRARHAADHADLPHRRHRRLGGHHPGSAPRRRAVRGPHAEGRRRARPHVRCRPDRGRGQRPPHHHRRRRRVRGGAHRVAPCPPRGHRRPGGRRPATRSSRARRTRSSCSRSRASARRSSTSSTRCRTCTATRACRSTTSTSS